MRAPCYKPPKPSRQYDGDAVIRIRGTDIDRDDIIEP